MAAITSLGIGSGLDLENMVTKLMEIERQPITRIEKQKETYDAELSAIGQLASALSKIQSAAADMKPSGVNTSYADHYKEYKANIINKDVASVSVTSGGKPASGSYQLGVEQIATAHRLATEAIGKTEKFQAGTLRIETGKLDGSNYTGDGSTAISVDIKDGDTLETIRDKINGAVGNVSATIISGDDGEHLVLMAKDTGTETTIKVSVEDATYDAGATPTGTKKLSEVFAFDPTKTDGSNKLSEDESKGGAKAQDAIITLNGVRATRSSNYIDDVIDGITIDLYATTKKNDTTGKYETTTITVSNDAKTKVTDALKSFVDAYNEQKATVYDLGKYNKDTKEMGMLQGRSILRSSQNLMKSMITGVQGLKGSQYQSLASIGVAFTKTGELELDSTKLSRALEADYDGVMALVGNVMNNVDSKLETFLGSSGSIENSKTTINNILSRLDNRKTVLERHVEQMETRMRKQFSSMDSIVGQWQAQGDYITQLVDSMNAARSKK